MAKKPKICLLHYSSPPVIGGVESVIESHAKLFISHGYEVKVIAGEGGKFNNNIDFIKISGVGSHFAGLKEALNNVREDNSRFNALVDKTMGDLSEALKDTDICFAHNILTMHFNLALSWAIKKLSEEKSGPKFVNWIHDMTLVNPDYPEEHEKKYYPWTILGEKVGNARYIAISELRQQQASRLFGLSPGEITVIPDGIDISSFLELSPFISEIFTSEGLGNYDIVAFTPTRILKRKNLETGIALAKTLKDKGKSVKWIISGAPDAHNPKALEYFHYLEDLIEKNALKDDIVFLSAKYERAITDEDIKSLYRVSDLLFFMSRQEGFGIPVLEAGLAGCLTIISDIPSLADLGGEESIHISLEGEDLDIKAEEIISYLSKSKKHRLFKRIIRNFTWGSIAKKKILPLVKELS